MMKNLRFLRKWTRLVTTMNNALIKLQKKYMDVMAAI